MHGIINRAFQGFLVETHGLDVWREVRSIADLRFEEFEAMLRYDDKITLDCFSAAKELLHMHPNALLEDLGTFLITHPPFAPLRRLLRFAGSTFIEFIFSLDEMADRGRMAMPDIEMPDITVVPLDDYRVRLEARWALPGIGPILLGALRAMADEYGTLAFLELDGFCDGAECILIKVFDAAHAKGTAFSLAETRT